jgi:hypothetical protein
VLGDLWRYVTGRRRRYKRGITMNIRKIAVVGGFDRILTADVAAAAPKTTVPGDVSPLEYELYGVAPITAGISSDSGSYDLFNGTLGEFDDAYNVELYALENGCALASIHR